MPLSTGQVLNNRYRVVKLLGQGGFGAVYRAWDMQMEGVCAVKENLDTTAEAQRQFEKEAKMLFTLRHSGLPKVFDTFVVPGQGQYLVMEYIEGDDLQAMLDRSSPPVPLLESQVLTWIMQVCDALSYLHTRQPAIIHRDVKPANIKITPENQAVLVDFGIAKIYDPQLITTLGARAVTPGYSPPEQYGQGRTDAQSDVYALGATAYALLTGRAPVESVEIMSGNQPAPPPVYMLNPQVSKQVSLAIEGAMQLNRAGRTPSAAAFKAALAQAPVSPPAGQAVIAAAPTVQAPAKQAATLPPAPAAAKAAKARPAWLFWLFGLVFVGVIAAAFLIARGMSGGGDKQSAATSQLELVEKLTPARTSKPESMATSSLSTTLPPATFTVIPEMPAARPTSGLPMGAQLGDTWTRPVDEMDMIFIPAGEFLMGTVEADATESPEIPQHTVYLDAYWIDQTEVTNAQYARCVAAGDCQPPSNRISSTRGSYYGDRQYEDYPVIYVSWHDAVAYCAWAGGRLPTEAEWEKAARGVDGQIYPWGNQTPPCNLLNYNGHVCVGDTTAVGSYPKGASPYGVLDMAGNVNEWVADWYAEDYYRTAPSENPAGPPSGSLRVARGGAWDSIMWYTVRSAGRESNGPESRNDNLGFRCAASSAQAPLLSETSAAAVQPRAGALPARLADDFGVDMALVPAGPFQMGGGLGNGDELPVHTVELDAFYMDIYEVTNASYTACVQAGACTPPSSMRSYTHSRYYNRPLYANYPVMYVDWNQAAAYCKWRGARLPTEAEWEKAARGGLEGKLYPWGDEAPVCKKGASNGSRFNDDGVCWDADTEAVGSYVANGYGLFDMAGNVWEWVNDWYQEDYYGSSPSRNPTGLERGSSRVIRGGAWVDFPVDLRSAARANHLPSDSDMATGFRCARTP